jgi:geranylgeranyl pyrophosphate synthase
MNERLSGVPDRLPQCARARLERLPAADTHPGLHEAMRYAVLGGGKRVRPTLAYAAARAVGVPGRSTPRRRRWR